MIVFAKNSSGSIYAIHTEYSFSSEDIQKLNWLLDGQILTESSLQGFYKGPRKEMLTPWATNAVEITQNMGINGILRIEEFHQAESIHSAHDKMLEVIYNGLG